VTVATPDTIEPVERLPTEPPKAFHAFTLYRDMPAHARSLAKVTGLLRGSEGSVGGASRGRRASGRVHQWSMEHRWVERAAAWDRAKDAEARTAQLKAVREANERHSLAARAGFNLLIKRLGTIQPAELTAGETLRQLKDMIMLERLVLGQPVLTERVEHRVVPGDGPAPAGGFVRHPNYNPTPAELAETMELMIKNGILVEFDDVPPKTEEASE